MSRRRRMMAAAALVAAALATTAPATADHPDFAIAETERGLRIEVGGELFTEYRHADQPQPILYPVHGPHGLPMTRNYPMKEVEGEANDHPHQRSLWFAHGTVNGVDFWHAGGRIVLDEVVERHAGDGEARIVVRHDWVAEEDGAVVCTDERRLTFRIVPGGRTVDYDVTIHASEGKLTFGDDKEGTMAIRTHPSLRLRPGGGVESVTGRAVNSEGVTGPDIWGRHAAWVDYWGEIEGRTVGIAIFDRPSNPRHPTTWHAREYGLVAANPFGLSYFQDAPSGTGDLVIEEGGSVTFRYRFFFHEGDTKQARIPEHFDEYAAEAAE